MRQDAIAILVLAIFVVACDEKPAITTAPPPEPRPVSVRIDGPTQLTPPAETQFTAVQTFSDGSTRDVTAGAQWTSTNSAVLSVSAGLAKALAAGEVGLTAQVAPLTSQPKSVRIVPATPDWDGRYTLTISAGTCSESLPLPMEFRHREATAIVRQFSLMLDVNVPGVGAFGGQIFNPQVRFYISRAIALSHPVNRASVMEVLPDGIRLARDEHRVHLPRYRRAAYWGPTPTLTEVLPDGNRLVISGEATTTMSPSGFAGTLNGAISLYEPSRSILLGVCTSSSHGFSLTRN